MTLDITKTRVTRLSCEVTGVIELIDLFHFFAASCPDCPGTYYADQAGLKFVTMLLPLHSKYNYYRCEGSYQACICVISNYYFTVFNVTEIKDRLVVSSS